MKFSLVAAASLLAMGAMAAPSAAEGLEARTFKKEKCYAEKDAWKQCTTYEDKQKKEYDQCVYCMFMIMFSSSFD